MAHMTYARARRIRRWTSLVFSALLITVLIASAVATGKDLPVGAIGLVAVVVWIVGWVVYLYIIARREKSPHPIRDALEL
ncbi:hypothetical protein [Sinomonas albida]|uniref:hypothetical protein n=1 Tax=Sinomonas albida TaxID=369942 RepID=UPI003017C54B